MSKRLVVAFSIFSIAAVALAVAGCGIQSAISYPVYDLNQGSQWVYQSWNPVSNGGAPYKSTYTVLGPAAFSNEPNAVRIRQVDSAYPNAFTDSYFKATADGILKLGMEPGQDGTVQSTTTFWPPWNWPSHLRVGDVITVDSISLTKLVNGTMLYGQIKTTATAAAIESVTVPAGTFSAMKLVTIYPDSSIQTMWIGPNGVGLVKETLVSPAGETTRTQTLTSYTLK